jgi:3-deoxy-D-manno-octulosonate 8-phosphate phosphatase (KDO 8-P phosphatase)
MKSIKLFITDIDGVWTNGGMYYDNNGNELKKFNTSDSAGVLFLKLAKINMAVITGEDTNIVKRRVKKLNIDELFMGVKNKVKIADKIRKKYNLKWKEIAYIGDDINDILLLRKVGLSACPSSAEEYIKKEVDWVLNKKGGEGVFREFVQKYLSEQNQLEQIINKYLSSVKEK